MAVSAPSLHREQVAPAFTLPGPDGRPVSRSEFRGKKNLILVFFTPDDPAAGLLRDLAARPDRLERLDARVLGIVPEPAAALRKPAAALPPPVLLLSDAECRVTPVFTALAGGRPVPAVVVLDRWGAVQARWLAPDLPGSDAVLDAVELSELECPECGDRHWPAEEWPV